jgi:hypothetical protein
LDGDPISLDVSLAAVLPNADAADLIGNIALK